MKLPTEAQLSAEQKEICYAPNTGSTLVVGPPGSGKTVVALYRARALNKQGRDCRLLMFNNVLKSYTDQGQTFHSWVSGWYRRIAGRSIPYETITDGNGFGRRVWDFREARRQYLVGGNGADRNGKKMGHVIIDEAQDFSPDAHELLSSVTQDLASRSEPGSQPSILLLADENQRLTDQNSNLAEIRRAHEIGQDDLYELRKNYRNTKQIADFAESFFVKTRTGVAESPDREGDLPRITITKNLNDAVVRIVRHAQMHADQEIGVLVPYQNLRKKLVNRLAHRLEGEPIRVQSYSSKKNDDWNDSSKLEFDEGGSITILCFASAKGLEFDTVFLPELQSYDVGGMNELHAKMALYVMTTRARQSLQIMISDGERRAAIWSLIPADESLFSLEA